MVAFSPSTQKMTHHCLNRRLAQCCQNSAKEQTTQRPGRKLKADVAAVKEAKLEQ